MWRYDEGDVTHIGVGHSAEITRVKIDPDGGHIVSVSTDGAVLRWRYPCGGEEEEEGQGEETQQQPEL